MRNLFQLIYRYHVFLIFLLLFILSISLLVSHNRYHRAVFLGSTNEAIGEIYSRRSELSEYLKLRQQNDSLARENAILRGKDRSYYLPLNDEMALINDSLHLRMYRFISAKVINNSTHRQKNLITIDRGSRHGIQPEMGVINNDNMIGIVKEVSENFSVIIPIINNSFKASVRLKGSREIGLLRWSGNDPQYAIVEDIPKHTVVEVGDTVISTGFSKYFPEGIITGVVASHEIKEGDNFHSIKLRLSASFAQLYYVDVVDNLMKSEIEGLEQQIQP